MNSTHFYLAHSSPTELLFGYCPVESDRWRKEVEQIDADVLVVGHTHTPFIRIIGKTTILNPGSLGQLKTGRDFACYVPWEDGRMSLKEYSYPMNETVHQIRKMSIFPDVQNGLIVVLKTGEVPSQNSMKTMEIDA